MTKSFITACVSDGCSLHVSQNVLSDPPPQWQWHPAHSLAWWPHPARTVQVCVTTTTSHLQWDQPQNSYLKITWPLFLWATSSNILPQSVSGFCHVNCPVWWDHKHNSLNFSIKLQLVIKMADSISFLSLYKTLSIENMDILLHTVFYAHHNSYTCNFYQKELSVTCFVIR